MSNKILYISKAIYPLTGGSVIITEKLAEQFSKDEMVVIGAYAYGSGKIVRKKGVPHFYTQYARINIKGRGERFFIPLRYLLFPFLLLKIYKVLKREKCTHILATFPDIFFCYASYLVAKWTNTPFSTYFHNTYLENRPSSHQNFFAKRWQPKIFGLSENIFVMSEGMQKFYESKYGNRYNFVPLVHTFTEYPVYKNETPSFNEQKIKLVLIGNINASNLEATIRLIEAIKKSNKYELYVYTPVPKLLLKSRGIDINAMHYMGYISDNNLIEELRKYHIGVITHGFTGGYSEVEYETIFPTRTIPFLLSGIPIFVHSPEKSFLTYFINKHQCADLLTVANKNGIINHLNNISEDSHYRQELLMNAASTVSQFYGPIVAKKLKQYISNNKGI